MPRTAETVAVAPPAPPIPTPPEGASTAPPARPEPEPAERTTVTAAIVSNPAGARVVREKDGAVIGMTPFHETWPSGDGVKKLRLELDGYRPESVAVPLDRGVDLSFVLRKAQAASEPQHKHGGAKHGATPAQKSGKVPAAAPTPPPHLPSQSEPVPL